MQIGILGGSFDPPHVGHIFISNLVKKNFGLHKVMWLIACQNPMKKQASKFEIRVNSARKMVSGNKDIVINTVEKYYRVSISYKILRRIIDSNKKHEIFWIMGSDCLQSFHKWHLYEKISGMVRIIIVERSELFHKHYKSVFCCRFKNNQKWKLSELHKTKNGWIFLRVKTPDVSSTQIKNKILS